MNRLLRIVIFIARFAIIGLAAAFIISQIWPQHRFLQHSDTSSTQQHAPASYAPAVSRAVNSVVSIYANKLVTEPSRLPAPLRYWFGDAPVGPPVTHQERSLGSGVIMSADGHILTNNHVIAQADHIQVLFRNGQIVPATIAGTDPTTDLAVLKVDAGHLPAIEVATNPLHVGDVVLAIGNPMGIGQTVTIGIVSAVSRLLGARNPESFIQTDAAINFGNSGGALIDAKGRLVGINTALFGRQNGTEGISFAIPAHTVTYVLKQIIKNGHVIRGWLGIHVTYLPPAKRASSAQGVLVTAISPDSPTLQAGLQPGDVLTGINEKPITNPINFYHQITHLTPGTHITLEGIRNKKAFKIKITLGQRPATDDPIMPGQ